MVFGEITPVCFEQLLLWNTRNEAAMFPPLRVWLVSRFCVYGPRFGMKFAELDLFCIIKESSIRSCSLGHVLLWQWSRHRVVPLSSRPLYPEAFESLRWYSPTRTAWFHPERVHPSLLVESYSPDLQRRGQYMKLNFDRGRFDCIKTRLMHCFTVN